MRSTAWIGMLAGVMLAIMPGRSLAQDAPETPPQSDAEAQPEGAGGGAREAEEPAPTCDDATSKKACRAACDEKFKKEKKEVIVVRDPRLRIHGAWALGIGGALLAAGGVTGGVALKLNGELEGQCPDGSCPPSKHGDLDTRNRLAVSSTILLASGFTFSFVAILVLAVFAPKKTVEREVAFAFTPVIGPDVVGTGLEWRF